MTKFLTALLFAALISEASGQVKPADSVSAPRSYFGAGGLGVGFLGNASATLTANVEIKNKVLLSANYTGEADFDISSDYSRDVNSFNILAGKIYKQRHSLISFSAGLGLTRVYTFDGRGAGFTTVSEKTIGIPLLIQAYAVGFQAAGVGLNLYGNLNLKQSNAGIHLCLALGRIATRPKNH